MQISRPHTWAIQYLGPNIWDRGNGLKITMLFVYNRSMKNVVTKPHSNLVTTQHAVISFAKTKNY